MGFYKLIKLWNKRFKAKEKKSKRKKQQQPVTPLTTDLTIEQAVPLGEQLIALLQENRQCATKEEDEEKDEETKQQQQQPETTLTTDCLYLVLKQVPLAELLTTVRKVSRRWAATVERLCLAQKKLTLQIGSEGKWSDIYDLIEHQEAFLIQVAYSPFHTLTSARLSKERTTFLTGAFPRLQTLSVVVSDSTTEDGHFLRHLPELIAAYADTLTTLQLVVNVKDVTLQTIFTSLIASIDSLRKLQRLSFFDLFDLLELPPFNLPLLLGGTSSPLQRLDFFSRNSSADIVCEWMSSLQARLGRQTKLSQQRQLQINYIVLNRTPELLPLLPSSAADDVVALFYSLYAYINFEAVDFQPYNQLRALHLSLSPDVSIGSVLPFLASQHLPLLTYLHINIRNQTVDNDYDDAVPVLSALSSLTIAFRCEPLQHLFFYKMLRPAEIFPNLVKVHLHLYSNCCLNCGWKVKTPEDRTPVELEEVGDEVGQVIENQCATLLGAVFSKPNLAMRVSTRAGSYYWLDFDSHGQMKLTQGLAKK